MLRAAAATAEVTGGDVVDEEKKIYVRNNA